jgi:hypothetical protein
MKNEARIGDLLKSLVPSIQSSAGKVNQAEKEKAERPAVPLPAKRFSRGFRTPVEFELRSEKGAERRARRGKMKAPAAVEGILKGALAQFGLDKAVDRYRFVTEWASIVGQDAAGASKPEYIKNHILYIKVKSSQWSQILSFKQNEILDRLEPLLGEGDSVSSIRFFVGEI